MSKGHSDRLTLQQYLQAHKIKRKLQQRNRSRSRGKQSAFQGQQKNSMQSIFQIMNQFLDEAKLDLSELFEQGSSRDKILIQVLALLDKFVLRLKEEIKKMYKDVYTLYTLEQEQIRMTNNSVNEDYFKNKFEEAEEEVRKSKLGEVVREKFKTDDKQKQILDVLVQNVAKKEKSQSKEHSSPKQANPSFMQALLGISANISNQPQPETKDNAVAPTAPTAKAKIQRMPQVNRNQFSPSYQPQSPRARFLEPRRQPNRLRSKQKQ